MARTSISISFDMALSTIRPTPNPAVSTELIDTGYFEMVKAAAEGYREMGDIYGNNRRG
jgi:hypothetical protein